MKTSDIRFKVELDDDNVPEKLFWEATNGPSVGLQETKAFTISIWDQIQKETLRIDLWGKEMPTHEMKRFYVDTIGGLANSLRSATSDEFMATEIENLCEKLVEYLKREGESPA